MRPSRGSWSAPSRQNDGPIVRRGLRTCPFARTEDTTRSGGSTPSTPLLSIRLGSGVRQGGRAQHALDALLGVTRWQGRAAVEEAEGGGRTHDDGCALWRTVGGSAAGKVRGCCDRALLSVSAGTSHASSPQHPFRALLVARPSSYTEGLTPNPQDDQGDGGRRREARGEGDLTERHVERGRAPHTSRAQHVRRPHPDEREQCGDSGGVLTKYPCHRSSLSPRRGGDACGTRTVSGESLGQGRRTM